MTQLTLTRPDDWHVHLRDGEALATTVPHMAQHFGRAIVMPNLKPPVTTVAMALAYRQRILDAIPKGARFTPLMTLYLTDSTSPEEMVRAKDSGQVAAVKLYPAGATTHAEAGVTDLAKVYPVLEAMEQHDLPLLVHGEVTASEVDIFDRERVFIERCLSPLAVRFPKLRIVFEHITTQEAVDFVLAAPAKVAATITAHHLVLNRNDLLAGGVRPHYYCLPVLKRETHRRALVAAATSGNKKFFLGTDSAPHGIKAKESPCGCAGIYSAPTALAFYAQVFEQAGALDKLEGFASFHGADFYGLGRNEERIGLSKVAWQVPTDYALGEDRLVPLGANTTLSWRVDS